jgi:hypothetical protein
MAITNFAVVYLKGVFRQPRPYWLDSSVGLSDDPRYGLPSGHAMTATVFYLLIAGYVQKRWVWILSISMSLLMGLSRLYLGVHFIQDILLGFALALGVLGGYLAWYRMGKPRIEKRILGQKMLLALSIPFLSTLLVVATYFLLQTVDLNPDWAAFTPIAEREWIDDVVAGIASFLGLGIGFTLEASRVRFLTDGSVWRRILRYLVGMVVLAFLFFGLREYFPVEPLAAAVPFRFLRYFLSTIWTAYYAPMLFVKIGLADAEPDKGIEVSMRKGLLGKQ